MEEENIWFNNIEILFDRKYLFDIIPSQVMTFNKKINVITRFSLYLSLLLFILTLNNKYFYIIIIMVSITYILHIFSIRDNFENNKNMDVKYNELNSSSDNNDTNNDTNKYNWSDNDVTENDNSINNESVNSNEYENITNKKCKLPTKENPFMNLLVNENYNNTNNSCVINKNIDNKISNIVSDKIIGSTNIYNNRNSLENVFYTMPNNKVPNDQAAFAKWCYDTPISCNNFDDGKLKQFRSCNLNK